MNKNFAIFAIAALLASVSAATCPMKNCLECNPLDGYT